MVSYLIAVTFHPYFFFFFFHCASEYRQPTFIYLSFFLSKCRCKVWIIFTVTTYYFLKTPAPPHCLCVLVVLFHNVLLKSTKNFLRPISYDKPFAHSNWPFTYIFLMAKCVDIFSSILKLRIKLPVHPGYYRPPANLENTTLLICIFNLWAMYFFWCFYFYFSILYS